MFISQSTLTNIDKPKIWDRLGPAFHWVPVGFGIGIAVYFSLASEPGSVLAVGLAMASIAAFQLALWVRRTRGQSGSFLFGFGLAGLGFVAAFINTELHSQPMLEGRIGTVDIAGTVVDRADRNGVERVILEDLSIEGIPPDETPFRIRISLRDNPDLRPGHQIELRAFLSGPGGPVMPGAFDFRRYAYFERIGAVGSSRSRPVLIGSVEAETGFWASIRHAIGARIAAVLPGQAGAVATALLTGERGAISEQTNEALRIAGVAHLLAISGLHVGLVAGLVFFAVRGSMALSARLAIGWPIKKIAAVAALVGCLGYVVLVGAPVPTQRAFLMALVVLAAIILDRSAISMRTVAIAALVVLVIAPHALLGPSFQLSFAAVVALVATYEVMTQRQDWNDTAPSIPKTILKYAGAVLLTTLIAGLATLPFSLFHFSRAAPWGLFANLVGVPLTAFLIMPLGIMSLILMPLGLDQITLIPMGWCIEMLIAVCTEISTWPSADIRLPAMPLVGLSVAVLGGLILCLARDWLRLIGIPLMVLALVSVSLKPTPTILVADNQSLIGFSAQTNDSLTLSSLRSARFVRGIWLEQLGLDEYQGLPQVGPVEGLDGRCDPQGCRFEFSGQPVSLARTAAGFAEDCGLPSLLIAQYPDAGNCEIGLVIEEATVRNRGALAVYPAANGGWRIIGTRDHNHSRPWSIRSSERP